MIPLEHIGVTMRAAVARADLDEITFRPPSAGTLHDPAVLPFLAVIAAVNSKPRGQRVYDSLRSTGEAKSLYQ
jgi:hypothetical protein